MLNLENSARTSDQNWIRFRAESSDRAPSALHINDVAAVDEPFYTPCEVGGESMVALRSTLHSVHAFGAGLWQYWRTGTPCPESNVLVQKLYAYSDGRSNDILFRMLEARRKEAHPNFDWQGISLQGDTRLDGPTVAECVGTLKRDGIVTVPARLKDEAIKSLYQLGLYSRMTTIQFGPLADGTAPGEHTTIPIASRNESDGIDLSHPAHSVYEVPRSALLENKYVQSLLCDPYLLTIATEYLGVFPVVTKPDMWWDTEHLPTRVRPRPFHVDSGCLRWLKVGINLTDTTLDSPHFVYVTGSHKSNKQTRVLTKRLSSRMNLSDREVREACDERIVHVTGPAGTITLADTRGVHKGELALRGHRLVLYFGLEGSAFNNIDRAVPIAEISSELDRAMKARPFSYQFFRHVN